MQSFSVLACSVPTRCSSACPGRSAARKERSPCRRGCLSGGRGEARGASRGAGCPGRSPDLDTGTCVRTPALRSPSAARPPGARFIHSLPSLHPKGDLLTIKSAAAAVQSPVPGSKGEDNVPEDRIEFLLLQSLLITLQTAHHTAILRAPELAPR